MEKLKGNEVLVGAVVIIDKDMYDSLLSRLKGVEQKLQRHINAVEPHANIKIEYGDDI